MTVSTQIEAMCAVSKRLKYHRMLCISVLCAVTSHKWGLQVRGRLEPCGDLVAAEAVYHRQCHNS